MMTCRAVTLGAGALASSNVPTALTATSDESQATNQPRVTVSFITDRNQLAKGDDALFGSDFPGEGSARIVSGTIDVVQTAAGWMHIPSTLKPKGFADRSANLSQLNNSIETGDAATRIVDDFLDARSDDSTTRIAASRKIFFIHGYRNTFLASVRSAAQLAHEHGTADILCFSWPTEDKIFGYWHDQANAPGAGVDLAPFLGRLLMLLNRASANRPQVDLIAHSMGAQVLTHAVQSISHAKNDLLDVKLLRYVVLCAADERYTALSEKTVLEHLPKISDTVTIYTNASDGALFFSYNFIHHIARLGAFGPDVLAKNVYWVDCTDLIASEGDAVSHSYFLNSSGVRNDLGQVLMGVEPGEIVPRSRVGQTNKYILPFDLKTPYARSRGVV
ncbi:alpha/beta hydrolase [Methylobacterium marchantiae]|uniref:Alpha/beta hydrolase n=1 Tax=Methylobacterium marchantiae TaxID=600331 RepID=A0ABW3WXA5_9HYPH|nr:hypothetical protein AIGOOFII_0124 [Methylobacterium marchantiae]